MRRPGSCRATSPYLCDWTWCAGVFPRSGAGLDGPSSPGACAPVLPILRPEAQVRPEGVRRRSDNGRMSTELLLIRHGETDWNRRQTFQGQIDVPLNARGLEQARRLGEHLAAEPLDLLVSSDLMRARQTAAPLASARGLEAQLAPALREQAFGMLEGLSFEDIRQRHPEEFTLWARQEPDYALPGGAESRRVFHARVLDALQALGAAHAGRRLAVVTHGGVLDMVWRSARNLPLAGPRECAIPNAGVNRLRLDAEGRLEILAWAEDTHLRDLPAEV